MKKNQYIIKNKTIFDKIRFMLRCHTGKNYRTQAEATAVTEYRGMLLEKINELENKIKR